MADEKKKPNPAERFGGKAGPGRPKGNHAGRSFYVAPSQQLSDMRKVYKTEKDGGVYAKDTPGIAMCRKLCRENPKDFLQLLNKLEEAYQAKCERYRAKLQESEKARTDGVELCEMIDKLIAEWETANAGDSERQRHGKSGGAKVAVRRSNAGASSAK